MKQAVVIAGLSPHPPIVVPAVGKGEEREASATCEALNRLGQAFAGSGAGTLVVITPHGPTFSDAVSVRAEPLLRGSLSAFGASGVRVQLENDRELVAAIEREAQAERDLPLAVLDDRRMEMYGVGKELDHGVVVPLHFIVEKGFSGRLVVVNMGFLPLYDLYRFGAVIERAAAGLGRSIAVLASGDLSHRLKPDAPAGYNPRGKDFDAKMVEIVQGFRPEEAVTFPADLAEDAGECGLRPIVMMMGALDRYTARGERLSYEGPFGVGYGVVLLHPESTGESRLGVVAKAREDRMARLRQGETFAVSLARATVESHVRSGRVDPAPRDVPPELSKPAGVFVSIHKEGMLRGCIGTTEPTHERAADEIVSNAVSAASRDPRFDPIGEDELAFLDYSVDVLSESEPVESEDDLDPKVYGVIVQKGGRKGLLLPDLPGVDTAKEQVRIAKRKAGISPFEKDVRLSRFTVTRYH
ncbi:MAG: AmmeMemoRadiSam system protein A [Bacillota bacterium]